jgi:hypothetical protein
MPFFTCFEGGNGVYICGKYSFVLVEIKAFQVASKTHFIVCIGFEKPYSLSRLHGKRVRSWV